MKGSHPKKVRVDDQVSGRSVNQGEHAESIHRATTGDFETPP